MILMREPFTSITYERLHTIEAISFAHNGINDIDLYCGICLQISYGTRRANVGENKVLLIPHGGCSLRRKIGRSIRADCRNKAQALLSNNTLHVFR